MRTRQTYRKVWLPAVALAAAGLVTGWLVAVAPQAQASPPAVDRDIVSATVELPSFANIIEAVQPAVVNISIVREMPAVTRPRSGDFEDFLRKFFERQSYPDPGTGPVVRGGGSGFVVDPDGFVVTNFHVVDGASDVTVTMNDGTQYEAEVRGVDPKTDLALLEVEAGEPLPYAAFGDSDGARVGDWVVAIGNPFGLGGTATTGIISARGRDIQAGPFDDFLQIDAPINRGNSGGPLFDLEGRVIGINTAIYSPNGGNVGIGFAIPSNLAGPIIEQLRSSGRVERGWLGVTIQPVNEAVADGLGYEGEGGALVASVVPDSPAAKAGIEPGDVIVEVGGEPVEHLKQLTRRVAETAPNESVEIEVWRNGALETLAVTVASSPSDVTAASPSATEPSGRLGLVLEDDEEGVRIARVQPESPAAARGLAAGDLVTMVGQKPVATVREAMAEIERAKEDGRDHVLLRVRRGDTTNFVPVPFA